MWAFNFFFFSRRLKRIAYLAARAVPKGAEDESGVRPRWLLPRLPRALLASCLPRAVLASCLAWIGFACRLAPSCRLAPLRLVFAMYT